MSRTVKLRRLSANAESIQRKLNILARDLKAVKLGAIGLNVEGCGMRLRLVAASLTKLADETRDARGGKRSVPTVEARTP